MWGLPILILLTTTSVQDSGLLEKVVPVFEQQYRCRVKIIAVGSGAAFRLGYDGTGDILIVHEQEGEKKFIASGCGVKRYPFMWNEFVLCGPRNDPARVAEAKDIYDAFGRIYEKKVSFVSRDDESGTHIMEKRIWEKLGVKPEGRWYIKSGNGMIETLRIAEEKNLYVLTDVSTFIMHRKEFSNISQLFKDTKNLKNVYSLIPVSKKKFPWVNYELAMNFVNFMKAGKGRDIIKNYPEKSNPLFNIFSDENNN